MNGAERLFSDFFSSDSMEIHTDCLKQTQMPFCRHLQIMTRKGSEHLFHTTDWAPHPPSQRRLCKDWEENCHGIPRCLYNYLQSYQEMNRLLECFHLGMTPLLSQRHNKMKYRNRQWKTPFSSDEIQPNSMYGCGCP